MACNDSFTRPILKAEERAKYVHNLQKNHDLHLEKILPWLTAHRFSAHWEVHPFLDTTSAVRNTYSYGIFSGERNAKYDIEMQEMTRMLWECQNSSEWVFFQGIQFYPVMDALLLVISEFMELYSHTFAEISGERDATTFSMDWITFQLRFYFSQIRGNQCVQYS